MPAQLRITALGTVLDLVFPRQAPASFVDAVAHVWSRCLADSADKPDAQTKTPQQAEPLTVAGPIDDTDEAVRAALQRLSQDVTRYLIAAQTGRLLMFHAGAVSHPATGRSVVFVAPSGTGKTTLAGLLGRSFGYLTDETVGIDPASGRIHPYPKPLSISPDGHRAKVETSPDDLGLVHGHPNPTVSRFVLLSRQSGSAASPRLEELAHPGNLRAEPPAAATARGRGPARRHRPGSPLHVQRGRRPRPGGVRSHGGAVVNSAYCRIEPLDALVVDGEALLLLEPDQVVRLSPIATAVFQITAAGASLESLLIQVEERFGSPADGDAETALQAILDDLVQASVLARGDDA